MQRKTDGDGSRGRGGQYSDNYSGGHGKAQQNGSQGVPDGYSAQDIQRMAGGSINNAMNYYDDDVPF